MTRSGNRYYYMADGLGSIRNVLDSSEVAQNAYDYYAFGDTLGTQTQGVTNPYRYTAREYESGGVLDTYYYRSRYYLSGLGIFASRDAFWADVHRGWGYLINDPVNLTDPFGLGFWSSFGWKGIVGAVATGCAGLLFATTAPIWVPIAIGAAGVGLILWDLSDAGESIDQIKDNYDKNFDNPGTYGAEHGKLKDSDGDSWPDSLDPEPYNSGVPGTEYEPNSDGQSGEQGECVPNSETSD